MARYVAQTWHNRRSVIGGITGFFGAPGHPHPTCQRMGLWRDETSRTYKMARSLLYHQVMTNEKADRVVIQVIGAIYDTIKETPEGVPESIVYLTLQERGISYESYTRLVSIMLEAGLITRRNHILFKR